MGQLSDLDRTDLAGKTTEIVSMRGPDTAVETGQCAAISRA